MEIPARVRLLAGIQSGSVYYFEDDQIASPEPHYYIVLNKNPRTEELLILVISTSQVEKRRQVAHRLGFPEETLVVVSPTEYTHFTKETAINCNNVFEKPVQSLVEKLESGRLRICTELMSDEIVQRIIAGVLVSTQVSINVQDILSSE